MSILNKAYPNDKSFRLSLDS